MESIVGDVSCYGSSGSSVNSLSELDRCDEVRIAADEAVIADNAAVLGYTVVVYGNSSAADIYLSADVAVADVSEVSNSSLFADSRILDLDKIAYFSVLSDMTIRSDMYERTYIYTLGNIRIIYLSGINNKQKIIYWTLGFAALLCFNGRLLFLSVACSAVYLKTFFKGGKAFGNKFVVLFFVLVAGFLVFRLITVGAIESS